MDALPKAFRDHLLTFLSASQLDHLLEGVETRRAVRVNPLKTTRAELTRRLEALGMTVEPAGFVDEVLWLDDPLERAIGSIWEHQAGHFFAQDAASALPVDALDPQPGERVLDLCAAPGSKATHLAERMGGQGLLVANDVNPGRVNNLISNLDQAGALNAVATQADGCRMRWPMAFDKVLVDAPCTNLGHMHASWTPVKRWSKANLRRLAGIQRSLLRSAFHACRVGGTIVYSTCTIDPRENEGAVAWLLDNFPVEAQAYRPGIGEPGWLEARGNGFHEGVADALRVEAGAEGTEGFFVAKLTKLADDDAFDGSRPGPGGETVYEKAGDDTIPAIASAYGLEHALLAGMGAVETRTKRFAVRGPSIAEALSLGPKRVGVYLSKRESMGDRLSFDATTLLGRGATRTIELAPDEARVWLSGQAIPAPATAPAEWSIVTCLGEPIGCARPFGDELPCYVPKQQRLPPEEEAELIGFLAVEGG